MKGNILIVDDHPGICLLLSEVFTYEDYDVTEAVTGQEALDKIENNSFDIILLDQNLPLINGTEVLAILNEKEFTTPIIFMSGMSEAIVEKVKGYSFVKRVVDKPFNLFELQTYVKEILTV